MQTGGEGVEAAFAERGPVVDGVKSRVPCLVQRPDVFITFGDQAFQRSGARAPPGPPVPVPAGMTSPARPSRITCGRGFRRCRVLQLIKLRDERQGASVASVSRSANSVKPRPQPGDDPLIRRR